MAEPAPRFFQVVPRDPSGRTHATFPDARRHFSSRLGVDQVGRTRGGPDRPVLDNRAGGGPQAADPHRRRPPELMANSWVDPCTLVCLTVPPASHGRHAVTAASKFGSSTSSQLRGSSRRCAKTKQPAAAGEDGYCDAARANGSLSYKLIHGPVREGNLLQQRAVLPQNQDPCVDLGRVEAVKLSTGSHWRMVLVKRDS